MLLWRPGCHLPAVSHTIPQAGVRHPHPAAPVTRSEAAAVNRPFLLRAGSPWHPDSCTSGGSFKNQQEHSWHSPYSWHALPHTPDEVFELLTPSMCRTSLVLSPTDVTGCKGTGVCFSFPPSAQVCSPSPTAAGVWWGWWAGRELLSSDVLQARAIVEALKGMLLLLPSPPLSHQRMAPRRWQA